MNRTNWTPGSLVEFDFIYGGCDLNNKLATYLGPDFIHRDDGVTITNHKIHLDGCVRLVDRTMLQYFKKVERD